MNGDRHIIVLAALFLSEGIGWSKGLGLGLGLAGVTLLALPGLREQTGHPFLGVMLALGASVSAAVATLTVKRLRPGNELMALAGTALSTWLWFWLLQRAEAGQLSLYLFLVPIFGLLIAVGGFGERLNALQGGSAALLLAAVAVADFAGWSGTARTPIPPGTDSPTKTSRQHHRRSRIGLRKSVGNGIEP